MDLDDCTLLAGHIISCEIVYLSTSIREALDLKLRRAIVHGSRSVQILQFHEVFAKQRLTRIITLCPVFRLTSILGVEFQQL